jgi:hypothetical protein
MEKKIYVGHVQFYFTITSKKNTHQLAYVEWFRLENNEHGTLVTKKKPLKNFGDVVIPVDSILERVFLVQLPADLANGIGRFYCLRRHRCTSTVD